MDALASLVWAEIAAQYPRDPEPLCEAAACLMRLGRHEEAADACARRTRLASHDPEAWGALAIASLRASRAQEAEQALRQVARLCPDDPHPRIAVALALRRRRRTLEALRELRAAVAMPAAVGGRRFLLGETLFGPEAWHAALADWANARREAPDPTVRRVGRSALDDRPDVECDATPPPTPVASPPSSALAALVSLMRWSGLRRGGPETSLRLLRDGVTTLLLARTRRHRKHRSRLPVTGLLLALSCWPAHSQPLAGTDAPALHPRVVLPAYETRAARDEQRACLAVIADDAVPACERALALGLTAGKASGVARRLALLHARGLRWPQAAQAWAAVAQILPRDPAPRVAYGHLLSQQGRHDAALLAFEDALRLAPEDVEALHGAGTALARLGRSREAIERIEAAARHQPGLFDKRPALAALLAALREGKPWP